MNKLKVTKVLVVVYALDSEEVCDQYNSEEFVVTLIEPTDSEVENNNEAYLKRLKDELGTSDVVILNVGKDIAETLQEANIIFTVVENESDMKLEINLS